jgi:hypothetical protein
MIEQTTFTVLCIAPNNQVRKRMKKWILSGLMGMLIGMPAYAEKLSGEVAIHIAKRHYEHPVRLLHPYLDVWHMKGPLTEKVALKAFADDFANRELCQNSHNANVVVLLEPQMFYNAQLRVFHAEMLARVFTTDSSTPIITIKKAAEQNGELAIKPEHYMEKAYAKAMDKVLKKLKKDPSFLAALQQSPSPHAESLCVALDALPASRIYY